MFPNKFDQYFRDKLLDHSTKVSPSAWKLIHAGLLRHKAFHFWKWYVAGPSVVVVALTGHLILAQMNKPAREHAGAAAHALTQAAAAPAQAADAPTRDAAASDVTTAAPTTAAPAIAASTGTSDSGAATASTLAPTHLTASPPKTYSATANGTVRKIHTTAVAGAGVTLAATDTRPTSNATDTRPTSNATNRRTTISRYATGNHTRHGPGSTAEADLLASDASFPKAPGGALKRGFSGAATQPIIVRPATRLAVTAQTPNPGSSKNLILPSIPYQPTGRWRIDGFASPEYFSFKEFGFSYGAGARATFVIKQHYTITTGLQYLKVDVTAHSSKDSMNSLFPGIFNNIQIPLLIGYTTGNRRFSVGVNAGAIFSVYADAKGMLKYYGWPNHNGITSYLGFNFATRVGDRLSLFAEPYIKCWYPQSTQDLPARLFSTGISVGLRFDLK
jgi:hypothetical protein